VFFVISDLVLVAVVLRAITCAYSACSFEGEGGVRCSPDAIALHHLRDPVAEGQGTGQPSS
jgi:hypothetical protein